MRLDPKTYISITNAWRRHINDRITNTDDLQREKFNKYMLNKTLNNNGDIILKDYEELKQSDNKDFLDEAIK